MIEFLNKQTKENSGREEGMLVRLGRSESGAAAGEEFTRSRKVKIASSNDLTIPWGETNPQKQGQEQTVTHGCSQQQGSHTIASGSQLTNEWLYA